MILKLCGDPVVLLFVILGLLLEPQQYDRTHPCDPFVTNILFSTFQHLNTPKKQMMTQNKDILWHSHNASDIVSLLVQLIYQPSLERVKHWLKKRLLLLSLKSSQWDTSILFFEHGLEKQFYWA